jgi:urea transport system ATP-binding protein
MTMLEVEGLRVNYGKSRAVNDITFTLKDGECLAVLGRNGVGKTTLLKCLIGLLPPAGGHVILNHRDISFLPPHERCRLGMAYIPQGREILPGLTVLENLRLGSLGCAGAKATQKRTEQMLEWFPILREHLNRPGGVLSGGQQQQLAVARALMTSPKLLLLDEPTEGIQPNVVEELGEILQRIRREEGLSLLLVEQNLGFARAMAERCLILEKGTVVREGKTEFLGEAEIKKYLSV